MQAIKRNRPKMGEISSCEYCAYIKRAFSLLALGNDKYDVWGFDCDEQFFFQNGLTIFLSLFLSLSLSLSFDHSLAHDLSLALCVYLNNNLGEYFHNHDNLKIRWIFLSRSRDLYGFISSHYNDYIDRFKNGTITTTCGVQPLVTV